MASPAPRHHRAAGRAAVDTYYELFQDQAQGRVAGLKHIENAHTDGDTYVWFKTANLLSTGDTFTQWRYPNIDFANGGNIRGMIAATEIYLKLTNAKRASRRAMARSPTRPALVELPQDADHGARPHGEAGQGRQERG